MSRAVAMRVSWMRREGKGAEVRVKLLIPF
jgi:hypothetical protein